MAHALEAKHTGGREPLEVVVERYQPQLQWIMFVTNTAEIALSVIMGADAPILEYVERDDEYIAEMVKRGKQFMHHVRTRTPPVALAAVPPPAKANKTIDMMQTPQANQWGSLAFTWLETRADHERCIAAEKELKAMVPLDCKKAYGAGIQITAARGEKRRLSLREQTDAF